MFECKICNKVFKYKKGLSKHLSYTHKINLKNYYDKWLKGENEDRCPICNETTTFRNFRDGYTKLCKTCLNKSKFPSNKEYWIYHGYTENEALENVINFQREQSKKVKNRINNTNISYWLSKGFSEEDAKIQLKLRQSTNKKENFIKRYGKKDGENKWRARQIKWQTTLQNKSNEEKEKINKLKGITLENMIRKWGVIDGPEKYNDWKMAIRGHFPKSISTVSQELFFNILNFINDKTEVNFGKHNKEFYIFYNNRNYFYDFKYKNKIIEFNGDLFHANPKIFNENDHPNPYNRNLNSVLIWKIDEIKLNVAKNFNYEILIIWENDYKQNKEKELNKCLHFLNIENGHTGNRK